MAQKAFVLLLAALVALMILARQSPPATGSETATSATEMATAEVTEASTLEATEAATEGAALVGDPVRGETIFHTGLNGAPACSNCHQTSRSPASSFALAPNLAGVSTRAATRVPGMTAAAYLEDSIRHPLDFVVTGYVVGMYPDFGKKYADQDIADLVAYLETL